jgi:hypothetical protein
VLAFKRELEEHYSRAVESDATDNVNVVQTLRRESDEEIAKVQETMAANKDRVLGLLLKQVTKVEGRQ